jgi:predicted RNA-binding Zn ribbon-like protein
MKVANRGAMGTDLELCLDFTDTVDWRTSDHSNDTLDSYEALLQWSTRKGLLDREQAAEIGGSVTKEESARTLADAVRLREAIYRVFSAIAHHRKAPRSDLGTLNEYLGRGLSRTVVKETGEAYGWDWNSEATPDTMLFPVAGSAAMLLTSDDLGRVRECANEEEGCGSLFLDSSKSQSRRWCSMKSCGNRAKSKAFYDRHLRTKAR